MSTVGDLKLKFRGRSAQDFCLELSTARVSVSLCNWVLTDVYQSDMIIYVWGPNFNVTMQKCFKAWLICTCLLKSANWVSGTRNQFFLSKDVLLIV